MSHEIFVCGRQHFCGGRSSNKTSIWTELLCGASESSVSRASSFLCGGWSFNVTDRKS